MDPDATLVVIRELVRQLESYDSLPGNHAITEQEALALDLAEHIGALDQWLSKGGFLPAAWFTRRPR
jgi:hypothetical protein